MVDTFDKILLELERCLMGTSRRQFTDEFKRESVGLLASSGRPLSQIARELGIATSMLRSWRCAGDRGKAGSPRRLMASTFFVLNGSVGCGRMSGPFARRMGPLALV
ncbi:MAG: transposase [Methylocella sp.]